MTNSTQKKTNAKKSAKSNANSKTQNLTALAQINQSQTEIRNAEAAHESSLLKATTALTTELDKQKNKLEKAKSALKKLKEKSKSTSKKTKAFQINQDKIETQKKTVDDLNHAVKSLKQELEELKQAERYHKGKQKAMVRFEKEFAKGSKQTGSKKGAKKVKKKPISTHKTTSPENTEISSNKNTPVEVQDNNESNQKKYEEQ